MAVVNTWSVVQLDAYPEAGGQSDVVFCVHWRLDGVDGEHAGGVYGSAGVTLDADAPFAPYASLTEAQVLGWVKDALGEEAVAAYEANVAQQINDQVAPQVVTPPLPWSA
jgi:hypothetical protein